MDVTGFIDTFLLWTFVLLLSSVSCTGVKGQSQLIGSSQPVVATEGGDVVLPCRVEPPLDVEQLAVEWWRLDLPPDPLSRYRYAHLHRDGRDVEDMKLPSFAGRTTLFRDELKHGNLSLKIMNVTLSDQGRYTCVLPQLESRHKATDIRLNVDPNFIRTQTTETPLDPRTLPPTPGPGDTTNSKGGRTSHVALIVSVVLSVLVLAAGAGYYFIRRRQRRKDVDYEDASSEQPSVSVPR